MGLVKKRKDLSKELRLVRSTLRVSKKRDVSSSSTGQRLMRRGFIGKSGRITKKGRVALEVL
jgi:hypothetical protein